MLGSRCRRWQVVSALCALGVVGAPRARAEDASGTRELIIRKTYERLQDYTRGSGKEVTFRLSDFRTILPPEFTARRWIDVVTMPAGRMVEMQRSIEENRATRAAGVYYAPSWSESREAWQPGDAEPAGATIQRVLDALAARDAQVRQTEAITTFTVSVSLDGEERSYRAAFTWLPSSLTSYTFRVADNIVQGVEEAAREVLPAIRRGSVLQATDDAPAAISAVTDGDGRRTTADRDPGGGGSGPPQCIPESISDTNNGGGPLEGTGGHYYGHHWSSASFQFVCDCSTACVSKCIASVPSSTCNDDGMPVHLCHKMAGSPRGSVGTRFDGYNQGASCAAGFGCVQTSCLFCLCGLSVSVNIEGVEVSFTPSEQPEWDGSLKAAATCAPCTTVGPPPPPPPPDGGGGTGGGGGSSGDGGSYCAEGESAWNFDCGPDGSNDFIYYCLSNYQDPYDAVCSLCYGTWAVGRSASVATCATSSRNSVSKATTATPVTTAPKARITAVTP